MPRIAVTFAWLGVIAIAVGLNIVRYPVVSQMVSSSLQPSPVSPPPPQPQTPQKPVSLPAESKPTVVTEKPAIVAQPAVVAPPVVAKEPKPTPSEPTGQLVSARPLAPIEEMRSTSEPPDPADLGNGVRRLPPVDEPATGGEQNVAPATTDFNRRDW